MFRLLILLGGVEILVFFILMLGPIHGVIFIFHLHTQMLFERITTFESNFVVNKEVRAFLHQQLLVVVVPIQVW